jgi:hypothetical protein
LLRASFTLQSLHLYLSCNWVTGTYHYAWLTNLLLGCSQSVIFPISASQVAGIIGISHHAWIYCFNVTAYSIFTSFNILYKHNFYWLWNIPFINISYLIIPIVLDI